MPKKLSKGHIALGSISTLATTSTGSSSQTCQLPSVLTDDLPLPRLFVFDLDFTLWPLWVDTHVTPPLKPVPSSNQSAAVDRLGDTFSFYPDVPAILHTLPLASVSMAVASRTTTPDLARDMLKILHVVPPQTDGSDAGSDGGKTKKEKPKRSLDVFDAGLEIYPGSKIRHMEAISKKTGVPYNEMLFFDDERRNAEVESLGVTMCLVRDGVTWGEIERGVKLWRAKQRGIN